MKSSIASVGVPEKVRLPFATIFFVPEPVAADVQSLADLPTMALSFVILNTSEIHKFYLKVERHRAEPGIEFDAERARCLIEEGVMTSISWFGNNFRGESVSFDPNYGPQCYELRDGARVLYPNARARFFAELCERAQPARPIWTPPNERLDLRVTNQGVSLTLPLAGELRFSATTEPRDQSFGFSTAHESNIFGTAKLLGKRAIVSVRSENGYRFEERLPIRNWLTQEVLHYAVIEQLRLIFAQTFGGLANDDLLDHLLADLAFDLK